MLRNSKSSMSVFQTKTLENLVTGYQERRTSHFKFFNHPSIFNEDHSREVL